MAVQFSGSGSDSSAIPERASTVADKRHVHEDNILNGPGGGPSLEQFTTEVVSQFRVGNTIQKEHHVVRTFVRSGDLERMEHHLLHLKDKAIGALEDQRAKQSKELKN